MLNTHIVHEATPRQGVRDNSPLLTEIEPAAEKPWVILVEAEDLELVQAQLVNAQTQVTALREFKFGSPESRKQNEQVSALLKDHVVFRVGDVRKVRGVRSMKAEYFDDYKTDGDGWFKNWFFAQRRKWEKGGGLVYLPEPWHNRIIVFPNTINDAPDIFQRGASDLFPYDEEGEHSTCPWHATWFDGEAGMAECLDRLHVYVVPDGTKESYQWAQRFCGQRFGGLQQRVHLVELDYSTLAWPQTDEYGEPFDQNEPFGSDDWFASHDAAEFIKIAEATPLWTPGYRVKFDPERKAVAEFGDELKDADVPLVKKIMPKTGVGLLVARKGVGKTFLSLDFAHTFATGDRFLGHKITEQVATIWLAYEQPGQLAVRLKAFPEQWPFIRLKNLPPLLDGNGQVNAGGVAKIIAEIDKAKLRLAERFPNVRHGFTIIDTLMKAANYGAGGESPQNTQAALNALYQLSEATDSFVLANDHFGKDPDKGARGGSPKEDSPDLLLYAYASGEANLWVAKIRNLGVDQWGVNFKLNTVEIETDEDGDPVTTCRVAIDADQLKTVAATGARRRKKSGAAILHEIRTALGAETSPEALERAFGEAWGGTAEARRKAFERASKRA